MDELGVRKGINKTIEPLLELCDEIEAEMTSLHKRLAELENLNTTVREAIDSARFALDSMNRKPPELD